MAWYKWGLITSSSSSSSSNNSCGVGTQNLGTYCEEVGDGGGCDYSLLINRGHSYDAINSQNLRAKDKEQTISSPSNNSSNNNNTNNNYNKTHNSTLIKNTTVLNSNNKIGGRDEDRDGCSSSTSCNVIDTRYYHTGGSRYGERLDGTQASANFPEDTIDGNNNNTSRVNCNLIGRTVHYPERLGRRLMRFQWNSGKALQGKIKGNFI